MPIRRRTGKQPLGDTFNCGLHSVFNAQEIEVLTESKKRRYEKIRDNSTVTWNNKKPKHDIEDVVETPQSAFEKSFIFETLPTVYQCFPSLQQPADRPKYPPRNKLTIDEYYAILENPDGLNLEKLKHSLLINFAKRNKSFFNKNIEVNSIISKADPAAYAKLVSTLTARLRKLKQYFVLNGNVFTNIGNMKKLICNPKEIYKVILDYHSFHHSNHKLVYDKIAKEYANITREMCKDYGSYCGICLGVKPGGQLYLRDLNPIISLFARQRIQIDLINMSHYRFPDFTHFLHLKDHYSNFSYVQGLQSKSATEVQRALEIYLSTNPSPMLLQSDNGRKFVNATIKALLVERKIGEVHSSPNSIEPANEIFKKYFDANLREYGITATDNDPKYGKFPHVTLLIARTVYQMNKTRAHDGSTSPMAVYFRMDPIIEENYQKLIKILKKMTSSPTDAEKAKVLKHELETILEKQQSVCHVENSDRRK